MFKVFKKGEKRIDDFLPENLKLGLYLKFSGLEFSNMGTKSKFIFEREGIYIEKMGTANLEGKKLVNLYLGGVEEQEAYIQLRYNKEEIEHIKLFVNYDYIYPESNEEWIYWLGKDKLQGIIGDETFIIDDEAGEKIERILFKVASSFYKEIHNLKDVDFFEEDSYIRTNIIEKIAILSKKTYEQVKKHFEEKLEDEEWLLDIQQYEHMTDFYYTFTEEDLQTEYFNLYEKGKSFKYKEKRYSYNEEKKDFEKKVYEKRSAIYSRDIEDEFFDEEFMLVNYLTKKDKRTIALDLGISLTLNSIKKV